TKCEDERERVKDADQRIWRKRGVPFHVDHGERRQEAEAEHAAIRRVERLPEQQPEGDARDGRLTERGAEERHASRDDEMAHAAELQSPDHLVCRLLLEKKKHKMR